MEESCTCIIQVSVEALIGAQPSRSVAALRRCCHRHAAAAAAAVAVGAVNSPASSGGVRRCAVRQAAPLVNIH